MDDEELVRNADVVGGRTVYPDEFAGFIGMLCLGDAAWCTGQVVCANGGMRMAM